MVEKVSFKQLDNEPDARFKRFVIYRDLGIHRNLCWAYQRYLDQQAAAGVALRKNANPAGPRNVPGSWVKESKLYQWPARAAAFDLDRRKKALERPIRETGNSVTKRKFA